MWQDKPILSPELCLKLLGEPGSKVQMECLPGDVQGHGMLGTRSGLREGLVGGMEFKEPGPGIRPGRWPRSWAREGRGIALT